MEEKKSPLNEFAIISLVLGIASFISLAGMEKPILAIIFGFLALKRMEIDIPSRSKKMAKAGIALGIIALILTLVFIIKFLPSIQQKMMHLQKDGVGMGEERPLTEELPGTKLY